MKQRFCTLWEGIYTHAQEVDTWKITVPYHNEIPVFPLLKLSGSADVMLLVCPLESNWYTYNWVATEPMHIVGSVSIEC